MVKKFTADCDFGGKKSPVTLYIGNPAIGSHPLAFQNKWLSKDRGGAVPGEIMDSFSKLKDISEKNKVSFEELCAYVIEELNATKSISNDVKKASSLADKPVVQKVETVKPAIPAQNKEAAKPDTKQPDPIKAAIKPAIIKEAAKPKPPMQPPVKQAAVVTSAVEPKVEANIKKDKKDENA